MFFMHRTALIPCRISRHAHAWMLTLIIALFSAQAHAESPQASEYDIKAAIVFKIAKFVSWPDQAFNGVSEPLQVCVHHADPLAEALDSLSGKAIHGRVFRVRHLNKVGFEIGQCQILLLSNKFSVTQRAHIETLSNQPVLTIADNDRVGDEQNVEHPGIIGLEISQNRVRFAIDVNASETAGLDISAQLLQLADIRNSQRGS